MGIQEDISWLNADADHKSTFMLIAKRGTVRIRDLKEELHEDDWWPVKYLVGNLVSRALVSESGGRYSLTEAGKNAYESIKTVGEFKTV